MNGMKLVGLIARVRNELVDAPGTVRELAAELELPARNIQHAITKLIQSKNARSVGALELDQLQHGDRRFLKLYGLTEVGRKRAEKHAG